MRFAQKNSMVIVGNGCAAAECTMALRKSGYRNTIHLVTDSTWPVANPMLTTYYAAGKIPFDRLFPYGASQEFYRIYDVEVHAGSPVVTLDAERRVVVNKSGLELTYDKCLIATGASPFVPPMPGIDSDRVFTIRTVNDAIWLKEAMNRKPRKALVVGASMVGLKLVELFHDAGMEVCLADLAQHMFPLAAHPDCARVIEDRLEQKGIKLRFGTSIDRVEDTGSGIRAHFKGSAESEDADLLAMCTGVKANTGFVDREHVSVSRGILVDARMRTSVPGLYAAGDVTEGDFFLRKGQILGLWAIARLQGRTAGTNMAGGDESFRGDIPHNISHFMGMDFVSIGDVHNEDKSEQTYDGKRFIQLFWKDGLLVGVNLLDRYTESGVIKNALIKGLSLHSHRAANPLFVIQNRIIQQFLTEVERA